MIIFSGKTKEGKPYVIRHLEVGDTEAMMNYINKLLLEQTYILRQGEQCTYEEEKKFVDSQIEKMKERKAIHIIGVSEGVIIGSFQINLKERVNAHVGSLGVSVAKGYRDQGIGSKMFEMILEQAKKVLPGIKVFCLEVFAVNDRAKHLYKKFGFREFGYLPKAILYKGKYVDEVYMYREA